MGATAIKIPYMWIRKVNRIDRISNQYTRFNIEVFLIVDTIKGSTLN